MTSFTARLLLLTCACSVAASCGSKSQTTSPTPDAGGGDTAPAIPDAAPDGGASPDLVAASPDTGDAGGAAPDALTGTGWDGPTDVARDLGLTPTDAAIAVACGNPGVPACPYTYLGAVTIEEHSQMSTIATMTPDGTMYLGGSFNTAMDLDPTAGLDVHTPGGDSATAYLSRLSPTGTYGLLGLFDGGGRSGTNIGSLSATPTGLVAVGSFDQSVDLDPGPGVDTHALETDWSQSFAVKLTPAGKFVWGRSLESTSESGAGFGPAVATDDGNVYLSGGYIAPADLAPGPATHAAPNATGVFITRLDDKGNQVWVRALSGADCAAGSATVVIAHDGTSPWLVGTYQGQCAFDAPDQVKPTPPAESGIFMASLTLAGQLRGLFTIVGGNLSTTAATVAPDGSLYLAGSAWSHDPNQDALVDFDPSAAVANRTIPGKTGAAFVLKLDQMGAFRWVRLDTSAEASIQAMAATPDNGLIIAGYPQRQAPVGMPIIKLAADQREEWRFVTGGLGTQPTSIVAGAKSFVVIGSQYAAADFDPSAAVDRVAGSVTFFARYGY